MKSPENLEYETMKTKHLIAFSFGLEKASYETSIKR